jgi:hypothetical protein
MELVAIFFTKCDTFSFHFFKGPSDAPPQQMFWLHQKVGKHIGRKSHEIFRLF